MISVIIRNKNESAYLKIILNMLSELYSDYISEIILVDNRSADNSVEIAAQYGCKIVTITDFTYGRALNLGISHAKNNYILLLSAHAMPIGKSFFTTSLKMFKDVDGLAGLRYVNSFDNYRRAFENDFEIKDGLNFGLMNACSMINKKVWQLYKFDEQLIFSEDKEWSERVLAGGYKLRDCTETFFYFANRKADLSTKRFINETIAKYQLHSKPYIGYTKIFLIFIFNIFYKIPLQFFRSILNEVKMLKVKFFITKQLGSKRFIK